MADESDPRLRDVHHTDLTESRVNEDFVDWLKNKGPTWMLVALVALAGYIGLVRYKQFRVRQHDEAWAAYFAARLPGAFEDVARNYGKVDRLAELSRLGAAEIRLQAVRRGLKLAALGNPTPTPADALTAEERTQYLAHAEELYDLVAAADDGNDATTILAVTALSGKAAVAESRGDAATAAALWNRAAERAGTTYADLADRLRGRSASADEATREVRLPARNEALTIRNAWSETLTPVTVDPDLDALIEADGETEPEG